MNRNFFTKSFVIFISITGFVLGGLLMIPFLSLSAKEKKENQDLLSSNQPNLSSPIQSPISNDTASNFNSDLRNPNVKGINTENFSQSSLSKAQRFTDFISSYELMIEQLDNLFNSNADEAEISQVISNYQTSLVELRKILEVSDQLKRTELLNDVEKFESKLSKYTSDYISSASLEELKKIHKEVQNMDIDTVFLPKAYSIIYGIELETISTEFEIYEKQLRDWMKINNVASLNSEINELRTFILEAQSNSRLVVSNADSISISSGDRGSKQLYRNYEILITAFDSYQKASYMAEYIEGKLFEMDNASE